MKTQKLDIEKLSKIIIRNRKRQLEIVQKRLNDAKADKDDLAYKAALSNLNILKGGLYVPEWYKALDECGQWNQGWLHFSGKDLPKKILERFVHNETWAEKFIK